MSFDELQEVIAELIHVDHGLPTRSHMHASIRGVSGLLRRLQDDGQDLAAIHATAEGFLGQHYDVPYEL
ncbi:hypothetical protein [Nocardia tengchongensis]